MKRSASLYLLLVLYGAVVVGAEDQVRHRPEWAQWGMLLLWAGLAWPFFAWGLSSRKDHEE
jgi:hypothetical protein